MFGGACWAGGQETIIANFTGVAEGNSNTEMRVFDGRVVKYGPGQKLESFCPTPGHNSIFAGRRFVYTRSDFLSFGSLFEKHVVRDSARHGSKVTEGFSNIEVPAFKMMQDDASAEMAQDPKPGASHPHAPGVHMT